MAQDLNTYNRLTRLFRTQGMVPEFMEHEFFKTLGVPARKVRILNDFSGQTLVLSVYGEEGYHICVLHKGKVVWGDYVWSPTDVKDNEARRFLLGTAAVINARIEGGKLNNHRSIKRVLNDFADLRYAMYA